MTKRYVVLGALIGALLPALASGADAGATAPRRAPDAAPARSATDDYRCQSDVLGHNGPRIHFRRVVNTRTTVAKSSRPAFSWRPVSWGLIGGEQRAGSETMYYVVPGTDGRVRVVRTAWGPGSARLGLRVVKNMGGGYPTRLITFADTYLYWVGAGGVLHRASFNNRTFQLGTARALPFTITGATAITAITTTRGPRVYYTDRAGALHVIIDKVGLEADTVLRSSGFAGTTGLEAGACYSPNYVYMRPYAGLLSFNRVIGVGHFQRLTRPGSLDATLDGVGVTAPKRLPTTDWHWYHLG